MAHKKCKIFYSWQSDNKKSRYFIDKALKEIKTEDLGLEKIYIDRDTKGLPGSPNIENTILEKIKNCDLFVADVTFINPEEKGRKVPNPNVSFELGYAAGVLGWDRIILMFCKDSGDTNNLPFDFKIHRNAVFTLNGDTKQELKRIASKVKESIKLLKNNGMLYGGKPDVVRKKTKLANALFYALKSVSNLGSIVLYNDAMDDLMSLQSDLDSKTFDYLHNLLSDIMSASTILDDPTLDCNTLLERYFDPLFYEYEDVIQPVDYRNALNKDCFETINSLRPTADAKHFSYQRYMDDKLIFSSKPDDIQVISKDGDILCKGSIDNNGLFSGFKVTYHDFCYYNGNYANGVKDGDGTLYKEFDNDLLSLNKTYIPSQSGIWKNGEFLEGICYDMIIEDTGDEMNENTVFHLSDINDIIYLGAGGFPVHFEYSSVYLADVEFKDGVGKLVLNSLRHYTPDEIEDFSSIILSRHQSSKINIPYDERIRESLIILTSSL